MKTRSFVIGLVMALVVAVAVLIATPEEADHPPHKTQRDAALVGAQPAQEGPQQAAGSNLEGLQLVTHRITQYVAVEAHRGALAAAAILEAQAPLPPVETVPAVTSAPGGGDSSGTCAIPQYICDRESGGDPTIYNTSGSGASGKYQFMRATWNGYMGYANAADAPEWVQDQKASELWAGGAGCSHWSAC